MEKLRKANINGQSKVCRMTTEDLQKQNQQSKASIEEAISLAHSSPQKNMLIQLLKKQLFNLMDLQIQHSITLESVQEFIKETE